MYKPPERIRHALPLAPAPSRQQAEDAMLFAPLQLPSGLLLQERTWVPAMVPWRATEEGFVTSEVLDWYARFARGQPGALVVEATGIRDVPSGPLLRIGHDRFLPGLRQLVETVARHSRGRTRLFIQIIDFLRIRRRPPRARYLQQFLALTSRHRDAFRAAHAKQDMAAHTPQPPAQGSSPIQGASPAPTTAAEMPSDEAVRAWLESLDDDALAAVLSAREHEALQYGARERVWDTDQPHIAALPQQLPPLFAAAAERAQQAGFDGVELHYAHAYTMASFLSARNTRSDGYGAIRKGRVRLPIEVLAAVRQRVGTGFTVGCRMLCDEIIDGGSRVEDASFFAVELARAGLDYLSLSTGGKFEDAKQPKVGQAAYPYTGRSGWECMPTAIADPRGPFGRNIPKQAHIRHAVRAAGLDTPVVICGGIRAFDQAERYLQQGDGDIIAAARQTLADPDWFRKLRLGRGDEVRFCTYTNYCEALDQKHRQVTCQLWDRTALDTPGIRLSHDGRRRLVAPPWPTDPEASEEAPRPTPHQ